MVFEPSPNGRNGARNAQGQFTKGNPGGPGNPYAKQVARVRSLVLEAVGDKDLRAIINALVERAKGGDVAAAREVLNRLMGRPSTAIDPEQYKFQEERLNLQEKQVKIAEDRVWMME